MKRTNAQLLYDIRKLSKQLEVRDSEIHSLYEIINEMGSAFGALSRYAHACPKDVQIIVMNQFNRTATAIEKIKTALLENG